MLLWVFSISIIKAKRNSARRIYQPRPGQIESKYRTSRTGGIRDGILYVLHLSMRHGGVVFDKMLICCMVCGL